MGGSITVPADRLLDSTNFAFQNLDESNKISSGSASFGAWEKCDQRISFMDVRALLSPGADPLN